MQVHTRVRKRRGPRARRTAATLATTALLGASLVAGNGTGATAAPKAPEPADLRVAKLGKPPATAKYGSSFGLGAVIANSGGAAAAPSSLRVLLSEDKAAGSGDIVGATIKVKRVPAGRAKTVSGQVRVPADARGSFWVIACADAARKVRESKESNNCRVSGSQLRIETSIEAELSGTLTFVDAGATDDGTGRTETWERTATARVKIAVTGDPSKRTRFTSIGSTYERSGLRTKRHRTPDCFTEITRSESGSGALTDYQSEISGHFTRTDLSGVQVGLQIPAVWTETTTRTPQRENGCIQYGTTTMGKDIVAHSVELKEVSMTASAITYEVVGWTADMGMDSDWEELTGQLVLRLK